MIIKSETCSVCFCKFSYNAGFLGFGLPEVGGFFSGYVCPDCVLKEQEEKRRIERVEAEAELIKIEIKLIEAERERIMVETKRLMFRKQNR